MSVIEVKHPLIAHKLGKMRREGIPTKDFRALSSEIAMLLTYEATKDLEMVERVVEGWAGEVVVEQLKGLKVTLVPILRAGLGMLQGVLDLIPSARVSVVGFERNEVTLQPRAYYQKLTSQMDERTALILDPMLATGGTAVATVELLKEAGCKKIKALFMVAAPEGIAVLQKAHPEVEIYTASIDEGLDENSYILPGLGDAGDKIFGTLQPNDKKERGE